MVNLYGNDLIGRVDVNYQWVWVHGVENITPPEQHPSGGDSTLVYSRMDNRRCYFKDHLGSVRTIVDKNGNILSAQDYYPYGEILRGYSTGGNTIRKRFSKTTNNFLLLELLLFFKSIS